MKKQITLLVMALAVTLGAQAQRSSRKCPAPMDGSKVVWQGNQGGYQVTKYLVKQKNDENDEFSVRYKINLTKLVSSYDKNGQELQGLDSFIKGIMQDSLKQITRFEVSGYASPDGPHALNVKLALQRAEDFKSYLIKEYNIEKYPCTLKSEALGWAKTKESLENSSLSNKAKAIDIIESNSSALTIENKLKAMPAVWSYMLSNTLPPMRCIELNIYYSAWQVVEKQELIQTCEPRRRNVVDTQYVIMLVDNSYDGVLLESSTTPLDYDEDAMHFKFKDRRHNEKVKEHMRRERFKEKERRRRNRLHFRERYK